MRKSALVYAIGAPLSWRNAPLALVARAANPLVLVLVLVLASRTRPKLGFNFRANLSLALPAEGCGTIGLEWANASCVWRAPMIHPRS